MNTFQNVLAEVLKETGDGLEIIAVAKNQVNYIYRGTVYNSFSSIPPTAQFAIMRNLSNYRKVYTDLARKVGHEEAINRMCWCLFGSADNAVDIDVSTGRSKIEVASHCINCQYEKPFCCKVLAPLTKREQQCFLLMRTGMTDKEIARKLNLSYLTVIKHMNNAVAKFRDMTDQNITRSYILTKLQEAGI